MNSYLFLYSEGCGTEKEVESFIDNTEEIANWISSFPNSYFIASDEDLEDLSTIFTIRFRPNTFILLLIDKENIEGLLMAYDWKFITNPKPVDER